MDKKWKNCKKIIQNREQFKNTYFCHKKHERQTDYKNNIQTRCTKVNGIFTKNFSCLFKIVNKKIRFSSQHYRLTGRQTKKIIEVLLLKRNFSDYLSRSFYSLPISLLLTYLVEQYYRFIVIMLISLDICIYRDKGFDNVLQ